MKLHRSITFKMVGRFDSFTVPSTKVGGVAAADVEAPRSFQFLSPDVKPIATRSWRFNVEDAQFIKDEVAKLQSEGIIESSENPWRAQVLVIKDERHKRRMVVDYS